MLFSPLPPSASSVIFGLHPPPFSCVITNHLLPNTPALREAITKQMVKFRNSVKMVHHFGNISKLDCFCVFTTLLRLGPPYDVYWFF